MGSSAPSNRRQTCRRIWRWTRIAAWIALALIASTLAYLHFVGVPNVLKDYLQTELRSRGIDLQLGRVRLRGIRTFLVENLTVGNAATNAPELRISRADLQLDPAALARLKLELSALQIYSSQLRVPLTNTAPDDLAVDNIAAQIHFPRDGNWHVEQFTGRIGGAEIELTARLANPLALRRRLASPRQTDTPADWQRQIREIAAKLNTIRFVAPSTLQVHVDADARNPASFKAHLFGNISGASTPWGECNQAQLHATLIPSTNSNCFNATLRFNVDSAEGTWGKVDRLTFNTRAEASSAGRRLVRANWEFSSENLETAKAEAHRLNMSGSTRGSADSADDDWNSELTIAADEIRAASVRLKPLALTAQLVHPAYNRFALEGTWSGLAQQFQSPWGNSDRLELTGRIAPANSAGDSLQSAELGPWRLLTPFSIDWNCNIASIVSPQLEIDSLQFSGKWLAPNVTIPELKIALYGGNFVSSAELNIHSRELRAGAAFDFDAHRIEPLLTTNAQRWLRQFKWDIPPQVQADARLILPAWTNKHPDWRKEVLPTVELAGTFAGTNGSFRKMPVTSARSSFSLTNLVWRLPDLTVTRPEGMAVLDYVWHMFNQDYVWQIDSQIDPTVLKPILNPPQQRVLSEFEFERPPRFVGEIRGRWHDPDHIGFNGRISATNFTFRGEFCSSVESTLYYTNFFLVFLDTTVLSGPQQGTAPGLGLDLIAHHLYVTNAVGNLDPYRVTKVIGPKTHAAIKPYQFSDPPTVILNGRIPTHPKSEADAHFNIRGQSFRWWKLRTPEISGDAYWRGDTLSISNLQAAFYNGKVDWEGHFDFKVPDGANFNFRCSVLKADLGTLGADLTGKTNHLDGILTGQLTITSANSEAPESWTGFGKLRLRDGFLWNIPIFGAFSPLLERIAPGLGSSRINAATANFTIEKGQVSTSDLELRSPAVRLQYSGWADLSGRVDAKVQAEILRDAWAVGPIVSMALWPLTKLFEYKVTGSIYEPKSEPLYVPKFVTWPLQPLRAIRQVIEGEQTEGKKQ